MTSEPTALVRALNDDLRRTLTGGRIMITQSVQARPPAFLAQTLALVAAFDAFDPDNDPWDEHDFGAIEVCGDKLFWKIDYYDPTLSCGSADPSDPKQTVRVLTIMLAEDY